MLTGVLVYLFLMRKMTGEMVLAAVLTTVALGILLRGVIVLVWSAQQQYPAQRLDITNFAIALPGGARISLCAALLVVTTALVYGALLASGITWRTCNFPQTRRRAGVTCKTLCLFRAERQSGSNDECRTSFRDGAGTR